MSAGGFAAWRIHGIFGSENDTVYTGSPPASAATASPKHLVYEVFGPPGTVAGISYFDVNADPQWVAQAHLPWTLTITSTSATIIGNIAAQGDSNSIGCRILVDGDLKSERISTEANAYTFCMLKAA